MSPMQQMFLGLGAATEKTYIDNIFDTTLYVGNESSTTVTTGIDLATDGGLIIGKSRGGAHAPFFYDTVRGVQKYLRSDVTAGEVTLSTGLTAFSTTGFSVGSHVGMNDDVKNAAWSFKKTPGFFDVITYTGTGSATTISHNLGSRPGFIMVKKTSSAGNWCCYHSSLGATKFIKLDQTYGSITASDRWNDTEPTSSVFSIGTHAQVNTSNASYVAYLFAGGESTAATARSVAFSSTGSNDGAKSLTIASSSDTDLGSGDFTLECWFKDNAGIAEHDTIFALENYGEGGSDSGPGNSFSCYVHTLGIKIFDRTGGGFSQKTAVTNTFYKGQWTHFAWTRSGSGSNNNTIWINGINVAQFTGTLSYTDGQDFFIGGNDYYRTGTPNSLGFNGNISNVRITKGQAVYTSAFKPSTTPMTTTTGGATASNVKVICCNNSSITGSSVTSGTITSTNTPTASTDSPFDDPAGFVFGKGEDQNVIKTGSYVGTGSAGIEVNIGWEPQLIIVKSTADGENWEIYDSMRGISDGAADKRLRLNSYDAEDDNPGFFSLRPNGFIVDGTSGSVNTDGDTYIYIAIRRPDGYVGKPADAGTDVFNTVDGDTDGVSPFFKNIGFPVDLALFKRKNDSSHNWGTSPRLTQGYYLSVNQTRTENSNVHQVFDYMSAWNSGTDTQGGYFSYAWKRHAGFDVIADKGNGGTTKQIAHGLGVVPQMIWRKNRDGGSDNWQVYHFGLNGGTNPHLYRIYLNTNNTENADNYTWVNAPTATHFTVGSNGAVNRNNEDFITMLFASVSGISKVGYYDGTGSSRTITTGFQPRFLFIKSTTVADEWWVLDTLRGWASGDDKYLYLNASNAEGTHDFGAPTSTGFTLLDGNQAYNSSSHKYIYYAHA